MWQAFIGWHLFHHKCHRINWFTFDKCIVKDCSQVRSLRSGQLRKVVDQGSIEQGKLPAHSVQVVGHVTEAIFPKFAYAEEFVYFILIITLDGIDKVTKEIFWKAWMSKKYFNTWHNVGLTLYSIKSEPRKTKCFGESLSPLDYVTSHWHVRGDSRCCAMNGWPSGWAWSKSANWTGLYIV